MTIKEFATARGVTPQSVYLRLKSAGIEIASIKKERGKLSEEGIEILNNLYGAENQENTIETEEKDRSGADEIQRAAEIETLKKEIEELKQENRRLKAEKEEIQRAAEDWRKQAEQQAQAAIAAHELALKLQEMLETEQRTAQQAQALQMASMQAFARPWWKRLLGIGKKEINE